MTPEETKNQPSTLWDRIKAKRNDIFALVGLLAAFGSWGYTALNPQPSLLCGLSLIALAALCAALVIIHILEFGLLGRILTLAITGICLSIFAKYVVVTPALKREFVTGLQAGYNLRDECGNRGYYEQTPSWMRDAQERWKATVLGLVQRGGHSDDIQLWSNSQLVGLAKDSNYNGFRCTEMAVKTAALETIVSRHYDPTIKQNPYTGPVYVFNPTPDSAQAPEELEKQKRLTIRAELGKLLGRNTKIREDCQRDEAPKGFSCWTEWLHWRYQTRSYISRNMESTYLARFKATVGTNMLYKTFPSGRFLEGKENDAVNLLAFSAGTLDQFIREFPN
jgi:hypothetical protein